MGRLEGTMGVLGCRTVGAFGVGPSSGIGHNVFLAPKGKPGTLPEPATANCGTVWRLKPICQGTVSYKGPIINATPRLRNCVSVRPALAAKGRRVLAYRLARKSI
jgi:hypothetical protein